MLTGWPDEVRGVPNITLRSALFGSSRSASKAFLQRAEIYTQRPTQMRYTGPRLDQGDLDVWITLLHIARRKQMGKSFKTSAYELLKLQGKTDAGNNRKTLYKRLFRLAAGTLELSAKRYSYTGGLIDSIHRDDMEQKLVITLNLELSYLFGPNDFTHIDWSVRRSLNAKPLAQWLHGYLSTHAEPFPVSIDTLMMMAGSLDSSTYSREQNIRRALDALQHASNLHGQPFSYEISGGNVYVTKTPTSSQARHIARKGSGSKSKNKSRTIG
ncbi:plasmid replication initiator TrfA [Pseudomonas fluorescens]|uniref:plasmid replication initiator TrfA n=1 Tax=Pseudomonas fluorescens TaxID=294 RepID=UPI0021D0194B|nr:plasmid replication initiator TrfA [Pseudomonas fluorescens]UXV22616.1 plasmid replication initiator TrfA [Pseudomonas fluorescens]